MLNLKDLYNQLENMSLAAYGNKKDSNLFQVTIDPAQAMLAVAYTSAKTLKKIAEELGSIDQTLNSLLVIYAGLNKEQDQ